MAGLQKILLVEDNPQIVEIYTTVLKADGYTVFNAGDYEGALKAAKQHQPDLIFVDVMIPGKSGLELLQELRTNPEYLCQKKKIVLLTNLSDNDDVRKALDTDQADGYVIKSDIKAQDLDKIIKSFAS